MQESPFDTEFIHGFYITESGHDDADGAHQAGFISEYFVCCDSYIVTTRGTGIDDHCVQGGLGVDFSQSLDLIVNIASLYRTASWAVDTQDYSCGVPVTVGRTEAADDVVGTRLRISCYNTADIHQSGMPAGIQSVQFLILRDINQKNQKQPERPQQLEKNTPTAARALFCQKLPGDLIDQWLL